MDDLTFVTSNANKMREIKAVLGNNILQSNIDLVEIQGTSDQIAVAKAKKAAKILQTAVVVEDVSFSFEALGGMPGPYIKDFLAAMPLKDMVSMVQCLNNTKATATCTLAMCRLGEEPRLYHGVVHGHVVMPAGKTGFGWDHIFVPQGHTKTFAEMKPEEKNKISHRYKALSALKSSFNASFSPE